MSTGRIPPSRLRSRRPPRGAGLRAGTVAVTGDGAELRRVAGGDVVVSAGGRVFGSRPRGDPHRRGHERRRTLGLVTVDVPVDGAFLRRLHAGLDRNDRLVAARDGEIAVGPYCGACSGSSRATPRASK